MYPLQNWDEAWYAEITRNMALGKSLLVPFWNGQVYLDKPPLYFWLSLPFFKFFGPGEWQARIVSQLAFIGVLFLTYLIGKKLFSRPIGLLSMLILATLGQVTMRSITGNLDSLMIFFFLAAFYSYITHRPPLITGLLLGLSALVKGWFLTIFPITLIGLYALIVESKLPRHIRTIAIAATLPFALYFSAGFWQYGHQFLAWYVFTPSAYAINNPFQSWSLAYVWFVLRDIWPWLLLAPFIKFKKQHLPLLLTAFLFIFFLNFTTAKLDWYLLPAYPLLALVLASGYRKKALPVIGIISLIAIWNAQRVYMKFPDRSPILADLGRQVKATIPKNATVVLDDHDMPTVLYYSEHGTIYMVSEAGGTPDEWWQIKYTDIPKFVETHPNVWVITPAKDGKPASLTPLQ